MIDSLKRFLSNVSDIFEKLLEGLATLDYNDYVKSQRKNFESFQFIYFVVLVSIRYHKSVLVEFRISVFLLAFKVTEECF